MDCGGRHSYCANLPVIQITWFSEGAPPNVSGDGTRQGHRAVTLQVAAPFVALHLRGDELVDVEVEDAGVLAHLLIDHIVFGAV